MPKIIVTPLSALPAVIRQHRPSHVVTLLSPDHMIPTPDGFDSERHLKLGMNDIAEDWMGEAPPAAAHVGSLIDFGRGWDARAPMIVHCWAGVSRSMASAYTLLCDRAGPGSEKEIAQFMRARAPHAHPNRLIVRIADNMLKRDGRMVAAVDAMGEGTMVVEGPQVEFLLDRKS